MYYGTVSNPYIGSMQSFSDSVWGTAQYTGMYLTPQVEKKYSIVYYLLVKKKFFREVTGFVYRGDE